MLIFIFYLVSLLSWFILLRELRKKDIRNKVRDSYKDYSAFDMIAFLSIGLIPIVNSVFTLFLLIIYIETFFDGIEISPTELFDKILFIKKKEDQ